MDVNIRFYETSGQNKLASLMFLTLNNYLSDFPHALHSSNKFGFALAQSENSNEFDCTRSIGTLPMVKYLTLGKTNKFDCTRLIGTLPMVKYLTLGKTNKFDCTRLIGTSYPYGGCTRV
ncbi:MAG: hypothetical protein LUC88_10780 [Prevotella sp.]|nr:hypothetical protein [Prevotella sp.]